MDRPPRTPMYGEKEDGKEDGGKWKKEGVQDFAENASVHGVSYVFEKNVIFISR
jgi:hypothetical protein